MRITWITALYGFDETQDHIAVQREGEARLRQMGRELVGTGDLVAIYIPEGTDERYNPGKMKGRVVGALELRSIPPGEDVDNYFFRDWDGRLRWPYGWPCKAVFAPPEDECPPLREFVISLGISDSYQPFVAQFLLGPFRLPRRLSSALTKLFATSFTPLP